MSSVLHLTHSMEDQVSVFRSPSDRVAQLYAKAPSSLFVAFYDSQGYGGGILTRLRLRTGKTDKYWISLSAFGYRNLMFRKQALLPSSDIPRTPGIEIRSMQ
jgi:hypothetical protein